MVFNFVVERKDKKKNTTQMAKDKIKAPRAFTLLSILFTTC